MRELLIITEQKDAQKIEYIPDEKTEIQYQREIIQREMKAHCIPNDMQNGKITYVVEHDHNLDHFCKSQPDTREILSLLEALVTTVTSTEDAFLDKNRWYWNKACWTWDTENKELKGIYIPDRNHHTDYGVFLNGLISHLMRCCLADHWTNEDTILFLHRLYAMSQDLATETRSLSDFIESEKSRFTKSEESSSLVQENYILPKNEGFISRIRGLLFHKRRVALPFG